MESEMGFLKLNLLPELVQAVEDAGYSEPTPVQSQTIPMILAGRDILATAQTGTGKTAAFVLPLLQHLSTKTAKHDTKKAPRALILCPTRELAIQVQKSVQTYAKHLPLSSQVVYGGVSEKEQVKAFSSHPEVIVATTGRLVDHINKGNIKLNEIEILVLDEADRILDMGFSKEIQAIVEKLPRKRQNLMFSATFSPAVKKLSNAILIKPIKVEITRENRTAYTVNQTIIPVVAEQKMELLSYLIGSRNEQAMVFARTKAQAEALVKHLKLDGLKSVAIHGDKTQAARLKALNAFKEGQARVLVATDIASRGIDIEELPLVINFELPDNPQDYVHRIGRTGRAGLQGEAISLICLDEFYRLKAVEELIKMDLPREPMEGYDHEMGQRPDQKKITDEQRNNDKAKQRTPFKPRPKKEKRVKQTKRTPKG